jgi:hypothetical protein
VTAAEVGDVTDKRHNSDPVSEQAELYHESYESSDQLSHYCTSNDSSGFFKEEHGEVIQPPAAPDTLSFRVRSQGIAAHLLLSSWGLRLVRTHTLAFNRTKDRREEVWAYPFTHLIQMTKTHSSTSSKVVGANSSLERLVLEFTPFNTAESNDYTRRSPSGQNSGTEDTTEIKMIDVVHAERDEIFNLVVGWSESRWQAVSTREADDKKRSSKLTNII